MGLRGPAGRQARRTATGKPSKPKLLSKDQPAEVRAIFRQLAAALPGATAADSAMLEGMAQAIYLRQLALAELIGEAFYADADHGGVKRRSAAWLAWRTAAEQVRAHAQRLGGSPLDRQRLPEIEASAGDAFEWWLERKVHEEQQRQQPPKEAEEW